MQCPKKHRNAFNNIENLKIIQAKSVKSLIYRGVRRIAADRMYDFSKLDAVVYIAGSIFIENKQIEGNQAEFLANQIIDRVPFFVIGANFGPYYTEKYVQDNRQILVTLKDICFRDKDSFELFSDLNNVRWAADCLLSYDVSRFSSVKPERKIAISLIKNNGRSGFVKYDESSYLEKIVEIVKKYTEKDYSIVFINLCLAQKDNEATEYCLEKLSKSDRIKVCDYTGDENEVLFQMASSEYIIASRFHAMIFAWLLKRPVLPIVYGDKTLNAIKSYGFSGEYIGIDEFGTADMDRIDENRRNHYVFDVEDLTADANNQFRGFESYKEGLMKWNQ